MFPAVLIVQFLVVKIAFHFMQAWKPSFYLAEELTLDQTQIYYQSQRCEWNMIDSDTYIGITR